MLSRFILGFIVHDLLLFMVYFVVHGFAFLVTLLACSWSPICLIKTTLNCKKKSKEKPKNRQGFTIRAIPHQFQFGCPVIVFH